MGRAKEEKRKLKSDYFIQGRDIGVGNGREIVKRISLSSTALLFMFARQTLF